MKNVLNEGKKTVIDIKTELATLEEYQKKVNEAKTRQNKYEKDIRLKNREIEEEIMTVIKKRRADVEGTYKTQINKKKSELKKKSTNREKIKDKKISDRIKEETQEYVDSNRIINNDIKEKINKDKLPYICKSDLFISLFMPCNLFDLIKILISGLLSMVLAPLIIIFLTPWEENLFVKVLLYTVIILLVGGCYIVIRNTVVANNHQALDNIRNKKKAIKSNKRKIKAITRKIRNDKDESQYNLDDLDIDIDKINEDIDKFMQSQKDEIATFDNTTRYMLENEIRSKHEAKLKELENGYQKARDDVNRLTDVVDKMTLDISKKYDGYIGKEFLKIDKLDALIEIMDKGEAKTISTAIDVYNKKYSI